MPDLKPKKRPTKLRSQLRQDRIAFKQFKVKALSAFRKKGCSLCPEKEPCVLDAHHVDPETKEVNISKAHDAEEFSKELRKCLCVCRNCHAKIHAGLISI